MWVQYSLGYGIHSDTGMPAFCTHLRVNVERGLLQLLSQVQRKLGELKNEAKYTQVYAGELVVSGLRQWGD